MALAALPESIADRPSLVVIDRTVSRRHGRLLDSLLVDRNGQPLPRLQITAGEDAKTPERLTETWNRFARIVLPRDGLVIGVGGGTILDLAGFAASTWMRGVAFVAIPTTLLAAADASVGGKTAINLDGLKNPVGTFHAAERVLICPDLLATLPRREWRCGMAEVVKIGVIKAPRLFRDLEQHAENLSRALASGPASRPVDGVLDLPWTSWLLDAVAAKAGIVAADYREGGPRKSLNLGHTLAHALEPLLGLPHGEAVALGLSAVARLAHARGSCSPKTLDRIVALLTACGLPVHCPPPTLQDASRYVNRDKKISDGAVGWVLPRRIGHVEIDVPVQLRDVLPHLA